MKIKDVLLRDPAVYPLVNQGQARIASDVEELRGELATFVCEGQYADGIERIIRSFLDNLGKTNQKAAWVSGFFGSGKSHLLKMLSHLWQDTQFSDGATARSLVPMIPDEVRARLRELDVAGKRAGGVLAAAGSLPSGTMENVRLTILGILLRAVGLLEQYPQARFCLWLHSVGLFDQVKARIEADGLIFDRELNNLYVSDSIVRALIEAKPGFAKNEADARQLLRTQFPLALNDITTDSFLRTAKEALAIVGRDNRLPCTILVLDEMQQYIGDSNERSVLVTEVVEAVSKQLNSHVMVIGAGQSALTDVPLLHKLMDRFTIGVPLSDADVATVTRKVLLQKKPTAIGAVRAIIDAHAGEIARQLQGTVIAEAVEDRAIIVEDYPLLPVRRRFWEHCFRQIDAAGTQSALRSQLRIIHDAVAKISDRALGAVIPADELFESLAPDMVATGVLLRELNERIIQIGVTKGKLGQRVAGLIFLIGKLKRNGSADIGVRATKEHLADLLIDDLSADNGKVRVQVESILQDLASAGLLMELDGEYRLQTREGSEWDREFRERQARLNNDSGATQFRRDQSLYSEIDKIIRGIRLVQGEAKEPRQLLVHRAETPPVRDGNSIPVWARDGWSSSEKQMVEASREAGLASPIVFIFIPRQSHDDLRRLIVEADAAEQTLNAKGNPTTAEGQEARQSMEGRRLAAVAERDRLVREIVGNAKVFQGGGNEVMRTSLDERIKAATEDALVRLFPRFKDADSRSWETVIKRARDGADHPFQALGYTDATERHPVCQEVIATIGAGKAGREIRNSLRASPFGWPQDAIDAALIALHRSQHITATLNGIVIPAGQLDQNKIARAEFRVERTTLSMQDRLTLRRLFQLMGVDVKAGEESVRTGEFLGKLIELARAAGGDPPFPTMPSVVDLEDIQRLLGNEQLLAIIKITGDLEARIKTWTEVRNIANQRRPIWELTERLARHAKRLDTASSYLEQIEAIRRDRLLLDRSDPVSTLRLELASLLRNSVQQAITMLVEAYGQATADLAGNSNWQALPATQQEEIKSAVGLMPPSKPQISTDEQLVVYLDQAPLASLRTDLDAIPGRVARAIEEAARRQVGPELQSLKVESATLRTEDDVTQWVTRLRDRLIAALRQGPVLIK